MTSDPPLRVFVVEDSSLFRERLAENVEAPGRIDIVGYADSEPSAVEALQSCDWDVLILDLRLKQGSGLGVLKALRANPRTAHAAIIVLTNHPYQLYRMRTIEFGANYFFDKAHELHHVRDVLERMARERRIVPRGEGPVVPPSAHPNG
jgi:DNA-binding NarL/FixJ family response regulator